MPTTVHPVAERMLLDAAQRAQRRGAKAEALVLRLSQLPPPGAEAHHRRIARALLDDAATRHGGQVFALRNLDLVLLSPDAGESRALVARLFGNGDGVVQLLASDVALLAYVQERVAEDLPLPMSLREPAAPLPLGAAEALLRGIPPGELLHGQVASELLPGGALRPLFREAVLNLRALATRLPGAGTWSTEPRDLFDDLATQFDARTLAVACADIERGGPLSARRDLTLHLNLTLPAVLSPSFRRFAEVVRSYGGRAGIELALIEACADPEAFEKARGLIHSAGFTLALDGVGHQALRITWPGRFRTDLVKVEWSDSLESAGPDAEAALKEIGPSRVVLAKADSEAALRWGYARGVRRFQGRHMDAMLAASRLGACAFASRCTLRLCTERGSATEDAGRAGCANTSLLDAAA